MFLQKPQRFTAFRTFPPFHLRFTVGFRNQLPKLCHLCTFPQAPFHQRRPAYPKPINRSARGASGGQLPISGRQAMGSRRVGIRSHGPSPGAWRASGKQKHDSQIHKCLHKSPHLFSDGGAPPTSAPTRPRHPPPPAFWRAVARLCEPIWKSGTFSVVQGNTKPSLSHATLHLKLPQTPS